MLSATSTAALRDGRGVSPRSSRSIFAHRQNVLPSFRPLPARNRFSGIRLARGSYLAPKQNRDNIQAAGTDYGLNRDIRRRVRRTERRLN